MDGSLGIGSLRGDGLDRRDAPESEAPEAVDVPDTSEPPAALDAPEPSEPAQPSDATDDLGAPSVAAPATGTLVDVMLTRRSISKLVEPGPTDAQLDTLLEAAASVPDHGGLQPWRFAVVRGAGRAQLGDALAAAAAEAGAGDSAGLRDKAFAAPALIAVISAPQTGSTIPEWEQQASASSSGYAITLAAHALGLGASWRSTKHMDGSALRALLGMASTDRLLGWVNLGTPVEDAPPTRRETPDLDALVTRLQ